MSVKMRRRRRHDRAKRVAIHRREDGLFFAHGTFPASAMVIGVCVCGARWWSRDFWSTGLDDFDEAHAEHVDDFS